MQIKTFRAANLQAALEEIREQLGPNASVLKTRQCRDGFMGWLGRSYVEVTASTGEHSSNQNASGDGFPRIRTTANVDPNSARRTHRASGFPIDARQVVPFGPVATPASIPAAISPVMTSLADQNALLISLGVAPNVADRWTRATAGFISNLSDRFNEPWLEHLQRSVAREIHLGSPIQLHPGQRRIVALVGPTGVGKTTTIAKLAAGFRIQSKRRVGLLTIDTFRIAAIQQLQAYAQIMDLPMVVVESADGMPKALNQLGDVDLVLIDTAGRSPKGDPRIETLAELLRTAKPDETHLVMSATSTAGVIESAIEGFGIARPTATILTKLDETPHTAAVLSAITSAHQNTPIPISYLTHGQHVPDDIAVATANRLVARLLPTRIETTQIEAA